VRCKLNIQLPISDSVISQLKSGQRVYLNGTILTARDAAHERLYNMIIEGKPLPIEIKDQIIYYMGPCPARPGQVIGSAGPTTSGRMDYYTPLLLELGLKGMIGKGMRNQKVIDSIVLNSAIYFAAVGGAGALIAAKIKSCEVVAFADLGTEAIHKLEVENFPVIVAIDSKGNDIYKTGREKFYRPCIIAY